MKYFKYLFKEVIFRGIVLAILFLICPIILSLPFWKYIKLEIDKTFSLNPNNYCHLTDIDCTAVLQDNSNGKANVEFTEYLTFDVHADSKSNTFKKVLRELPEEDINGLKVNCNVKSVTQILDDGTEIPYTKTSKMYLDDSDYTKDSIYTWHHNKGHAASFDANDTLLIYIPWTYREKLTFKIVYSMNNVALKYKDCSELYLNMYSSNLITKLNSYKAQILIADNIMPSTYHAYTFGSASSKIPYTESDTSNPGYHTFEFSLDKSDLKFNLHDRYIKFSLLSYGKDKHIFTQNAPNNMHTDHNILDRCISDNKYHEMQNNIFKICKIILLIISPILSILIIYGAKRKYEKFKKMYNLYIPETEYEYFREIPTDLDPVFASKLAFMKEPFNEEPMKTDHYAAILLSLVRKQYINIHKEDENIEWNKFNTVISLINEDSGIVLEPLAVSEKLYYNLLKRYSKAYNNSFTIHQLETQINKDYNNEYLIDFTESFYSKSIRENGVAQGYFQKTDYDILSNKLDFSARLSICLSIIIFFIVNPISYLTPMGLSFGAYTIISIACLWKNYYLSTKTSDVILFTQYGANEQAKWYGLYNFLNSNALIEEKDVYNTELWEKYLIYATAFGIPEKVVKAAKIHAENLNFNSASILNNNFNLNSIDFYEISKMIEETIHTTSNKRDY